MNRLFTISTFIVSFLTILFFGKLTAFSQNGVQHETVVVDLMAYQPFEFRLQLMDALNKTENLHYTLGRVPGEIMVFSNDSDKTEVDIQAGFEQLQDDIQLSNGRLSKEELGEIYRDLKADIGIEFVECAMGDRGTRGENCINAEPICTTDIFTFPAGVNSTAEIGPYYACLASQPNPAWFYLRISVEGPLDITMSSSPAEDIDFICWGPFDDAVTPCSGGLTSSAVVDCSYLPGSVETCNLSNAQLNKYYILMITNYSNIACDITVQKTGGSGATDCSILPQICASNSPVCVTDQLDLFAEYINNASYLWTGPNGFSSTLQNPSIPNIDISSAGTYSLVISRDEIQLDSVTTQVVVDPVTLPDFTFNEVCRGEPTFFTDASVVDPPSIQITEWLWDFGDGNTSTGQNQQHVYQSAGTFQVTLTTSTATGLCTRSMVKSVLVKMKPDVSAGVDMSVPHNWFATLNATATGGSGDYTYLWEPQSLVVSPNNSQTNTIPLVTSTLFNLTVTDNFQGCVATDDVLVNVTGSPFEVVATANPESICPGDFSQLHANAQGGSSNYTYSWVSDPAGFSSTVADPIVFPEQTTTYSVTVFDGQNTLVSDVMVEQNVATIADAGGDISIAYGETTVLYGAVSGGSGTYSVDWQPANLLVDNSVLQPTTLNLVSSELFSLTVTDMASGCENVDQMLVTVSGGALSVTIAASPEIICQGQSSQLSAFGSGGSGNYSYQWTTNPPSSWSSTSQSPMVSPESTTVYQLEMSDGYVNVVEQLSVEVIPLPEFSIQAEDYVSVHDTIYVCVHDSVWLDAGPGYQYLWMNGSTNQMQLANAIGGWEQIQLWSVEITDTVSGCQNSDELTIVFDYLTCTMGTSEVLPITSLVSVYPNPTQGSFTIGYHASCHFSTLRLFSANGEELMTLKIDISNEEYQQLVIDVSSYEKGVYILQLQGNESVVNKMLIKR